MSFSAEAKDFLSSFASTAKLGMEGKALRAQSKYYDAATKQSEAQAGYYDSLAKKAELGTGGGASEAGAATAFKTGFGALEAIEGVPGVGGYGEHRPQEPRPRFDGITQAPSFAEGGLVEEPEEPEEEAAFPSPRAAIPEEEIGEAPPAGPSRAPMVAPGPKAPPPAPSGPEAIPTAAPAATQPAAASPEERDNIFGMAIYGATKFLQRIFGLQPDEDDAPAPQPAAIGGQQAAPKARENLRLFMSGVGASSPEEYDQLMQVIDPDKKLDDSIRTMSGIKAVYDYYLKRGDVDKANKSAASLVQYARATSAIYAERAEQALMKGDIPEATRNLLKSYNSIPDGGHATIGNGPDDKPRLVVKDANGKVTAVRPFDPQKLVGAALGLKSGQLFWQAMMGAATKNLGNAPSEAYQTALLDLYGLDSNAQPKEEPDAGVEAGVTPVGNPGETEAIPTDPAAAAPAQGKRPPMSVDGVPMYLRDPKKPIEGTEKMPFGGETGGEMPEEEMPAAPQLALPKAPQYIEPNASLRGQMTDKEWASYVREIANKNLLAKREYDTARQNAMASHRDRMTEYRTKVDAFKRGEKAGGAKVKPEDRGRVLEAIEGNWDGFVQDISTSPQSPPEFLKGEEAAIKDGAYALVANNDITPAMALRYAGELVDVDQANPRQLNFRMQPVPGGATIHFGSGAQMFVPEAALKNLAALRGQKIKMAETGAEPTKVDKAITAAAEGVKQVGEAFKGNPYGFKEEDNDLAHDRIKRGAQAVADGAGRLRQTLHNATHQLPLAEGEFEEEMARRREGKDRARQRRADQYQGAVNAGKGAFKTWDELSSHLGTSAGEKIGQARTAVREAVRVDDVPEDDFEKDRARRREAKGRAARNRADAYKRGTDKIKGAAKVAKEIPGVVKKSLRERAGKPLDYRANKE